MADQIAAGVPSLAALKDAVRILDKHGVPHSEIQDLGADFGIHIVAFRDPDNIQLQLTATREGR